jgi:xanthine dehydrogenase accessory factor
MSPEMLAALLRVRQAGGEAVLATRLNDGAQFLLPEASAPAALQDAGREALERERTGIVEVSDERWFLHVHGPAARVLIVGAVHIAQALTRMAGIVGLAVTVIDPRRGFATEERFAGVGLVHDWPDEAVRALRPDRRTAVVALSHDPKLDDPALDAALCSEAFFIGALGSRKSHARRLERLAALGHTQAALARISGPVGLDIGAVTQAEIALSILAEIVATRRGAGG